MSTSKAISTRRNRAGLPQGNDMKTNQEKLRDIRLWCDAYPLSIFPEPDLKLARKLLEAGGLTLDAVSASAMRHVLEGIRKILDEK